MEKPLNKFLTHKIVEPKMRYKNIFLMIVLVVCSQVLLAVEQEKSNNEDIYKNDFENMDPNELLAKWSQVNRNERLAITEALIEKKAVSVPVLREKILKGKRAQRVFAIKLLTEMRDKGAVPHLIKGLTDPEKQMRMFSINSLRQIEDPRATPELRKKMKEPINDEELACVLFALGKLGNRADIRTLEQYLGDSRVIIRLASASAIAMLGDATVSDILIDLSQSKEPFIQKTAIKSLGYLDTPESTQRLESILANPSANWKDYAWISLQQQWLRIISKDADKLKLLSEHAKNKNRRLSEWAIEEMADIGTMTANNELEKISKGNIRISSKAKRIIRLRREVAQ